MRTNCDEVIEPRYVYFYKTELYKELYSFFLFLFASVEGRHEIKVGRAESERERMERMYRAIPKSL